MNDRETFQSEVDGELVGEDYAQSSNSLFNFMQERNFLSKILKTKAIVPRYCLEDVKYLSISSNGKQFPEIYVLEKCFCDIPLHKITEKIKLQGIGDEYEKLSPLRKELLSNNSTHTSIYGEYGIAFSKNWAEKHKLQPIHYLNPESEYTIKFGDLVGHALDEPDFPDMVAEDILRRISYIKPLRGVMERELSFEHGVRLKVKLQKNFHDEQEWRYVPETNVLRQVQLEPIVADFSIFKIMKPEKLNENIEDVRYRELWLPFDYDEIRYIIVPNKRERNEFISEIEHLPDEKFNAVQDIELQKGIMCSKIITLEEIRKDW